MKRLSDKQVRQAADRVISHKGLPYSQSEFNMAHTNAWNWLKKNGATKRQMNLFEKLVKEAPTKGGRFNCYSGD